MMKVSKLVEVPVMPIDVWNEIFDNMHVLELFEVDLVSKLYSYLRKQHIKKMKGFGSIDGKEIQYLIRRNRIHLVEQLMVFRYVDIEYVFYGACEVGDSDMMLKYNTDHIDHDYASYLLGLSGKVDVSLLKHPNYNRALLGALRNMNLSYIESLKPHISHQTLLETIIKFDFFEMLKHFEIEDKAKWAIYALNEGSVRISRYLVGFCSKEQLGSWAYICGKSESPESHVLDVMEKAIIHRRLDLIKKHMSDEFDMEDLLELAIPHRDRQIVCYLLDVSKEISDDTVKTLIDHNLASCLYGFEQLEVLYDYAIELDNLETVLLAIAWEIKITVVQLLKAITYDRLDMLLAFLRNMRLIEDEIEIDFILSNISDEGHIASYINSVNKSSIEGILQ